MVMLHDKLKINTCQALLNACQPLIDQSSRHFGNNCTSVRHYGIRHFGIRHSGNHPYCIYCASAPSLHRESTDSLISEAWCPVTRFLTTHSLIDF